MTNKYKHFFIFLALLVTLSSCNALKPEKVDTRKIPTNAQERAKQNIKEGRGASVDSLFRRGNTNFQFSSSNPMWRASLEILDFLPLNTVDYSGGVIVSDWYSENSSRESIKISIRFLSNEIRSDSLKIIVHKKNCSENLNCKTALLNNSQIGQELRSTILRKAVELEKDSKDKKKR
tara:strand:- start:54 stop:584 length:531 start_codon:yes stop_codon:yes gene_type:complete